MPTRPRSHGERVTRAGRNTESGVSSSAFWGCWCSARSRVRAGDGVVYVARLRVRVPGARGLPVRGTGESGAGCAVPQVLLINWYGVFSVESIANFKISANKR